jgi:uncharacterized protein
MRFLLLLIVIVAVILVVRKIFQRRDKSALDNDPAAQVKPPTSGAVSQTGSTESMLRCAHCGVFVPASEAVQGTEQDSGQSYCCEQHRSLHKQ